jgi:hypothetical protein
MSGDGEKGHEERVHDAFDALDSHLGERVTEEARGELDRLRDAAVRKDAEEVRERLASVQGTHGWLYSEMVKHPKIATLIDELSLWGF